MGRESLHSAISEHVAGELRAQRARLDMTYDELAAASGVKRGSVMRALSGQAAIAVDVLLPLCIALKLDPAELLNGAPRSADPE